MNILLIGKKTYMSRYIGNITRNFSKRLSPKLPMLYSLEELL